MDFNITDFANIPPQLRADAVGRSIEEIKDLLRRDPTLPKLDEDALTEIAARLQSPARYKPKK